VYENNAASGTRSHDRIRVKQRLYTPNSSCYLPETSRHVYLYMVRLTVPYNCSTVKVRATKRNSLNGHLMETKPLLLHILPDASTGRTRKPASTADIWQGILFQLGINILILFTCAISILLHATKRRWQRCAVYIPGVINLFPVMGNCENRHGINTGKKFELKQWYYEQIHTLCSHIKTFSETLFRHTPSHKNSVPNTHYVILEKSLLFSR
jgi:hypothetical protein